MKILFRSPNWLGDAVISRILLYNLKGYDITVISHEALKDIFSDYNVLTFRNKKDLLKLSISLKDEKYDIGIVVPLSFSSAFFMYLTGVKKRVGFSFEMRDFLLTHRIKIPKNWKEQHTIKTQLLLLKAIGIEPKIPETYFNPECYTPPFNFKYAAISPFAAFGRAKEWPLERFIEASIVLNRKFGVKTVLLGTKEDEKRLENTKLPKNVISLLGKTTLKEASCIIKHALLFIGNDSGLSHLSAAMGQRTIAVFGPTSPIWTAPIGKAATYLWNPPECAPCYKRECPLGTKKCMYNVTTTEVIKKVEMLLNNVNK